MAATPSPTPQRPHQRPEQPDESARLADSHVVNTRPYAPPSAQLANVLTGFLYAFIIALIMLVCAAWLWLASNLPLGK